MSDPGVILFKKCHVSLVLFSFLSKLHAKLLPRFPNRNFALCAITPRITGLPTCYYRNCLRVQLDEAPAPNYMCIIILQLRLDLRLLEVYSKS